MNAQDRKTPREAVVLLHGVGLIPWFMKPIARDLELAGFRVLNIGYPSKTVSIEKLAGEWLLARLATLDLESAPRVHFVTHSMGSLLVRHLMVHNRPANTGRVVLIAPPSRGSELADAGRPKWLIRLVVGTNLKALGMSGDAFWRGLPKRVDYPTGVIAGTGSGNPLGRCLPKPNDGTITVESTRLDGTLDSVELPWSHTAILFHGRTAAQVVHFLRHGKFNHGDPRSGDPSTG